MWERCPRLGRGRPKHEDGKKALLVPTAPYTVLGISCTFTYFPPPACGGVYYHPHFTDEKTEAQRGVARLVTSRVETEPSPAGLVVHIACRPASHCQLLLPSQVG